MIKGIQEAVTIPVMAKARIGHFAEAQVLQSLEVDYIDESEVLTPADEANHIDKLAFEVPFVCGATNLGEALRRIGEGAAMIRSKGEAGTGNIVEAVRHLREHRRRHQAAADASRRGAGRRGQGAPRAARGGARGRRAGLAAGAAVLRRRDRHAGRRRADHAARRRGQLRRLRESSSPPIRSAARARSSRRPHTPTTPSASPPPRWAWASRCAATTSPSWPSAASCSSTAEPSLAGDRRSSARGDRARRRCAWASSPARATSPRTRGCCATLGADAVEVRTPEEIAGLDALVIPGGESTTITKAIERDGLEPAIRAHVESRPPAAGHLRRDDPVRPRPPRPAGRDRAAQRLRAPARQLRGRPRDRRASAPSRCAPCSSGRRGSSPTARTSRCSPSYDGHPVAVRDGDGSRLLVSPRADRRSARARASDGDGERRPDRVATRQWG